MAPLPAKTESELDAFECARWRSAVDGHSCSKDQNRTTNHRRHAFLSGQSNIIAGEKASSITLRPRHAPALRRGVWRQPRRTRRRCSNTPPDRPSRHVSDTNTRQTLNPNTTVQIHHGKPLNGHKRVLAGSLAAVLMRALPRATPTGTWSRARAWSRRSCRWTPSDPRQRCNRFHAGRTQTLSALPRFSTRMSRPAGGFASLRLLCGSVLARSQQRASRPALPH